MSAATMHARRTRATKISGIRPLDRADRYGRRTVPSTIGLVTERRERKWVTARNRFIHRQKNGVYDPYSFFHLCEALANIEPEQRFSSAELAAWLNSTVSTYEWDAVTVGRILNDLRDTWQEANGDRGNPLQSRRAWDGMYYWVEASPEQRAALMNILDDLVVVGEDLFQAELRGERPKKLVTPLASCPSVTSMDR